MESPSLEPVRKELIQANLNGKSNIASHLSTSLDPSASQFQVALIGVNAKWANRVRHHLFGFAAPFRKLAISDLGNMRHITEEAITDVAWDVAGAGAIPVFIGMPSILSRKLWLDFHSTVKGSQALFLQESFPTWLHTVNHHENLAFLGLQSHLLERESKSYTEAAHINWLRLSVLRASLEESEPAIRDTQYLNFDLSALRYADMPAQLSHSTSGLSSEEACRLARYAGLSPELRIMVLTGHDPMSTEHGPSANTTAQLLWYFMDGVENRVEERPAPGERFTQYVVHLQRFDFDLRFYKSKMTGRWWLELPSRTESLVFSCAYADYLAACEDVVTDRVINCVERSMNVPKS